MRSLHNEAFIGSVLIGVVDDCSATMGFLSSLEKQRGAVLLWSTRVG
jgi:hypothetical protein